MYAIDFSLTNGLGKPAISVYYSGCDIPVKCKECHNSELWQKQKTKVSDEEFFRLVNNYKNFNHSKELIITFLGGDPLAPYNRDSVIEVSRKLKELYPEVKIVVYSWRTPDEIEESWTEFFDYGVLGKFDIGIYVENRLPASTNQFIYDFKTKQKLPPIKLK